MYFVKTWLHRVCGQSGIAVSMRPYSLVFLLCSVVSAQCQQAHPTSSRFEGCYEVTSLSWHPADERINLIPARFELTHDNRIQPLPSKTEDLQQGSWEPDGSNLRISFGAGWGGFRGSLKPSVADQFSGRLKEWCDSRCEWQKRVGYIRIRKIECSK